MKLPYGQSNFKTIATEGFYYVDRTTFIEKLEGLASRFLFYLRPRKFGKSLFISMLGYYYGEEWKSEFSSLFGKYYIGKNPTPLVNRYLVLNFDFSGILTDTMETVLRSFTVAVKTDIQRFFSTYRGYFTEEDRNAIEKERSPDEVMRRFFDILQRAVPGKQLYILIDEYDHFANELIAFHLEDFRQIVSGNGFVRKFYEVIKEETKTGLVGRMFVTGVSPVTVDSLTSGFNIGKKVSLELPLHDMMGFTEAEAVEMLSHVGVREGQMPVVLDGIRNWYNGYLFHPDAPNRLYNPNMLIYFGDHYQTYHQYPEKMLDDNIASDYGKIRRILGVGGEAHSLAILEEVLAQGETRAVLTSQFSFDRNWIQDDYASLLFYLGMLTVQGKPVGGGWNFRAPNFVIKQLYYEYFVETLRQRTKLKESMYGEISRAVVSMSVDNDLKPFLHLVEKVIGRLSVRDARNFNESNLKAIFAALLVPSSVFLIRSEVEMERRFVDLLCTNLPSVPVNWNFAFELKYLKKKEAARLEEKAEEARAQLREYLQTDDLRRVSGLAAYAIVFVGSEAKSVEQVK
ncbi:MAG: AAA family ATPase [Lewinellaceae bacterium]|nr:AAA family ATPase [Phaeodactylibacter sp.]MCB9039861.1 AAA family ATPase [Lewinellaceae bacterium]